MVAVWAPELIELGLQRVSERRQLGQVPGVSGGVSEDAGKLAAIRAVLAAFDWEHDDRQYALEEIERIADGAR